MAVKKTKNRDAKKRDIDEHVVAQALAVEKAGDEGDKDVQWEATKGEVHSDTKFEDDHGTGQKVVIRAFDFSANPEAFRQHTPSKQELFDAHAKQIELFLYKDGLEQVPYVNPRVILAKNRKGYRIIVGAVARFGQYFNDNARTLTQIAHEPTGTN